MSALLGLLMFLFGATLLVLLTIYLLVPLMKGLVWLISHLIRFVAGMIGDTLRLVGALLTGLLIIPMTVGAVVLGRWSTSAHFGRALKGEVVTVGRCCYRLIVGHPARLLCLTPLTEGMERRIPEVLAAAPGRDTPSRRTGQFDGYEIVGSLPGGGSGAKLYVANPTDEKRAGLERQARSTVGQVVIKSFSTREGSSLPQIVRESRSLDAAKRMGLILEHDLNDDRFFYVMRYVPGESLGIVTQRLHGLGDGKGLERQELREGMAYACDLVDTLRRYHDGGLWHKDVKPDNIIIHDGGAHLVDFGLITPLRSSLTLTTHGTEYFRDPEMVRMALKGAKVHEVDGTKFDVYAAGAVLFSMIENSFPAHGGLSQVTKRCPEALRWVIRRAMTDYDKRYESTSVMLADLRTIANAADPFAVRPAELPSVDGSVPAPEAASPPPIPEPSVVNVAHAAADVRAEAPDAPSPAGADERTGPALNVTDWWTGRYEVVGQRRTARPPAAAPVDRSARTVSHVRRGAAGVPAAQQVNAARARAEARRSHARERMQRRRPNHASGVNLGVGVAVLAFLGFVVTAVLFAVVRSDALHRAITRGGASAPMAPTPPSPSGLAWGHGTMRELSDMFGSYRLKLEPVSVVDEADAWDDAKVIMLSDPLADLPQAGARAQTHVDRLRDQGVEVISSDGDVKSRDLIASLRLAIQLKPLGSEEAVGAIRSWLADHPDIGMAIWTGRGDDGSPTQWMIGADGLGALTIDEVMSVIGSSGEDGGASMAVPVNSHVGKTRVVTRTTITSCDPSTVSVCPPLPAVTCETLSSCDAR